MNIKTNPNSQNNKEIGTTILYSCPEEKYYFDYPVGENFTSFYNTININSINVTCNEDRWTLIPAPTDHILNTDGVTDFLLSHFWPLL